MSRIKFSIFRGGFVTAAAAAATADAATAAPTVSGAAAKLTAVPAVSGKAGKELSSWLQSVSVIMMMIKEAGNKAGYAATRRE